MSLPVKLSVNRRQQLGIPAMYPNFRRFTPAEDKLLGTKPDKEVARLLKRTANMVQARRAHLGIARGIPSITWSKKELALIGTGPDKYIAMKLGRTVAALRANREQMGRPPCNPVWKPWTPEELALLGKMPDAGVARRTGHSKISASHTRWNMGIKYENPERRPWTARSIDYWAGFQTGSWRAALAASWSQ